MYLLLAQEVVVSALSKQVQTEWCSRRCPNQSKQSGALSGVQTNPNRVVLSAVSLLLAGECAQRCPNQSKPSGSLSGVPPPRRGVRSAMSFLLAQEVVLSCGNVRNALVGRRLPRESGEGGTLAPIQNLNGQDRFV